MERMEDRIRRGIPASGDSGGPISAPSGTISVRELGIPRKATHELLQGEKAYRNGDYGAAEKHLQKALSVYPAYAEAHNDLGVIYEKRKQYGDAAGEFRKAVSLSADDSIAWGNLAVMLFITGQFGEAERIARQALKVAPDDLKSVYVLALCQLQQHGDESEALRNLERASAQFRGARALLSRIREGAGRREVVPPATPLHEAEAIDNAVAPGPVREQK